MKVLITGGAGFIGQHLARRLAPTTELTALDNLSPQVHLDPAASRAAFPGEVIVADVSEPSTWSGLARPDAVIHLAAETGTAQSMYLEQRYQQVNVEGTRLAAASAQAWGVPLVALSSRAVYGEGPHRGLDGVVRHGIPAPPDAVPLPSSEDDPHHPVSVYGRTKSEGEAALAEVSAAIPVGILRPQNVIGPGQALHNPYTGVLAAFLAMLREGRPLQVYGDGSQTRDFVHVTDLTATIEWLLGRLIDQRPGAPIVLNSGTGTRTSLRSLAEYAIAGSPSGTGKVVHVPVHRAGDIAHACADLTQTRHLGAPLPRWDTAAAVADFIGWSWDRPGAAAAAWEGALDELEERGLTS